MPSEPTWIDSLSTTSIATDMVAADINGSTTYVGLEKVFIDLAAKLQSTGSTLTALELSDLKSIAANLNNGISTSNYLAAITQDLVNGNAANSTWTGGAAASTSLGNLAIGASATQLSELIGKWFLGTDLPSSTVIVDGSNFSISYSISAKPLFATNAASINDVNQGDLGDCYLLSSLAEVASQNSSIISSMFTSNGNGTYGVCFHVNGQAEYITVNSALADGGNIFNVGMNIWASLAEKAYAQLQSGGVETGNSINYGNSFSTIGNGGAPEMALEEITNASAITDFRGQGNTWTKVVYNSSFGVTGYATGNSTANVQSTLIADLSQGDDLILSSYTNAVDSSGRTTLVANHAMSIIGFDSATGMFEIRNPWGSEIGQTWDTTFEVSLATLLADGDTITADNVGHRAPSPSLTVSDDSLAFRSQSVALSALARISDPGHVGYQKLELWDSNGTVGGGQFLINGMAQSGGHEIDVNSTDIANTVFKVGTVGGSDTLWARLLLDDGTLIAWQQFTVTAPLDHGATVTAIDITGVHGQTSASAANLFAATDVDGDAITTYGLWDSNGNGHWVIDGVAQGANHEIDVTAAQLAQASYQFGAAADQLWVRAFDGAVWGVWVAFNAAPFVDHAPVVTTLDDTAVHGLSVAASSLFSASDVDGDAITGYQLWDSTTDSSSGHWVVGGVAQSANAAIDVAAAQLSSTTFQTGHVSDDLWVRAFDGATWGAWQKLRVIAINHAAEVTVSDVTATKGEVFEASQLFSATDADTGDTIHQYQFWDSTADATSGYFTINGVKQAANQTIAIDATQLANTQFHTVSGSDQLWVRAYDGQDWGAWKSFNVIAPVDHAPVTVASDQIISKNTVVAASSLFSVVDQDNDTITSYQLWDSSTAASSGHWSVNGVAQLANTSIDVTAAQLASTTFQTSTTSDDVWARANDGVQWGQWHEFHLLV